MDAMTRKLAGAYSQIAIILIIILVLGIFFVLPCIETYQKVDLRTITLDVPPQEVLTRDSVTVSVGKIYNLNYEIL